MTAPQRRPSNDGFTVLEALVAMAVTGMILAAVATITGEWLPNWNRGFARVQGSEMLALGLERLMADLAAAEFVSPNGSSLLPLFEGADRSVTFVRSALAPNAPPGLEIVRIAQVVGARPSLVRTRTHFLPMAEDMEGRFGDPVVLLGAPLLVSLSYAGSDRIWKSAWQLESRLPVAIRVSLRDAAGQVIVSTATLVHAAAPAKCMAAKSVEECIASLKPSSQPVQADNLQRFKTDGLP